MSLILALGGGEDDVFEILSCKWEPAGLLCAALRTRQVPPVDMQLSQGPPSILRLVCSVALTFELRNVAAIDEAILFLEETRPANLSVARGLGWTVTISLWIYADQVSRHQINLAVSEVALSRRLLLRRLSKGERSDQGPLLLTPAQSGQLLNDLTHSHAKDGFLSNLLQGMGGVQHEDPAPSEPSQDPYRVPDPPPGFDPFEPLSPLATSRVPPSERTVVRGRPPIDLTLGDAGPRVFLGLADGESKVCPHCSHVLRASAHLCDECGGRVRPNIALPPRPR